MTLPGKDAPTPAVPMLCRGVVRHRRLRPAVHAFAYPTSLLLLPMRSLRDRPDNTALVRNRAGWLSFHDRDHGDGRPDALAWFDDLLDREGLRDEVDGEVWLHTYPRVLGYAFKPVSFWYGHRADGSLALVLAEVNNTFGERHCYLLHGPELAWGRTVDAAKVFHVSPFCSVAGRYRFCFVRQEGHLVARVDHDGADGMPLLETSVGGRLEPLTRASARRALLAAPHWTLAVIFRIHWQALKLFVKRVPFFGKPAAPELFVSR
ncbi:MAG: DUF1365 domain-containing protein [Rubrivivax sp.]